MTVVKLKKNSCRSLDHNSAILPCFDAQFCNVCQPCRFCLTFSDMFYQVRWSLNEGLTINPLINFLSAYCQWNMKITICMTIYRSSGILEKFYCLCDATYSSFCSNKYLYWIWFWYAHWNASVIDFLQTFVILLYHQLVTERLHVLATMPSKIFFKIVLYNILTESVESSISREVVLRISWPCLSRFTLWL